MEGTNTTNLPLYGTGSTTKTVSYGENPDASTRTISVTATCTQDTSISDTVSVSQSKKHVELITPSISAYFNPSTVSYNSTTSTLKITVTPSTAPWEISSYSSYLTPASTTGTGSQNISVSVASNQGSSSGRSMSTTIKTTYDTSLVTSNKTTYAYITQSGYTNSGGGGGGTTGSTGVGTSYKVVVSITLQNSNKRAVDYIIWFKLDNGNSLSPINGRVSETSLYWEGSTQGYNNYTIEFSSSIGVSPSSLSGTVTYHGQHITGTVTVY